ncbi:hypothetical protein [Streptomyces sp. NPDC088707]|uniref:hypothetical protein n=1 Tax=Streptomyces sp. NPDC088707 TaxID=3365871 RepID=UPI0038068610
MNAYGGTYSADVVRVASAVDAAFGVQVTVKRLHEDFESALAPLARWFNPTDEPDDEYATAVRHPYSGNYETVIGILGSLGEMFGSLARVHGDEIGHIGRTQAGIKDEISAMAGRLGRDDDFGDGGSR